MRISGIGAGLGSFDRVSGLIGGLRGHADASVQLPPLPEEGNELHARRKDQCARENDGPPIGRRLALLLGGGLGGLCLGFWGITHLDNKRYLRGTALITFGLILAIGGLGLWWATGLSVTWRWWL
jgi:hypothetical protein